MCRNIKTLFNYDPPASEDEIRAAAAQFVKKISGFAKPSAANQKAYDRAIADVTRASSTLIESLVTSAPARSREADAAEAHARAVRRFGSR